MIRRLLALLLGLAACGERPDTGDTDATSTSAGDTSTSTSTSTLGSTTTGAPEPTGATTSELEPCLEVEYRGSKPPDAWMLTCGLPELCAGDALLNFSIGDTDDLLAPITVDVDDLDRARCMAAALRDRTPGQVSWTVSIGPDILYWPLSREIVGDAVIAHSHYVPVTLDLPGPKNMSESLHRLRPPEFFAACADGDAMQVWLCLVDAFEPGCLPGPLQCPD